MFTTGNCDHAPRNGIARLLVVLGKRVGLPPAGPLPGTWRPIAR
jgi:hypothetical protein